MSRLNVYNQRRPNEIPKGAVYVGRGRGSQWGNPFSKGTKEQNIADFREYAEDRIVKDPQWLKPLEGKNVVCWCAPAGCHGEVLIELANKDAEPDLDDWADHNCPEDVTIDNPSQWEMQNLLA